MCLDDQKSTLPTDDQHAIQEEFVGGLLDSFKPLLKHQVAQIIQNVSKKSCLLDPLPTSVLVKVLDDVLVPVITKMVNLPLDSGWRLFLVLPLLKPAKEDVAFKIFLHVNNLCFVSKVTEKVADAQLIEHMHVHEQIAPQTPVCTESALLKVKNDMLLNIEAQKVTFPQGSCLGLLLCTIYTNKLFDVVERHLPDVHCYADDIQLYLAFSPEDSEAAVEAVLRCIDDLRQWMLHDLLKLNDDKTEFLVIGTKQLAKANMR